MMTHILTRYRDTRRVPWLLVLVGGLYMGVDAWTAAENRYVKGRLELLGGSDFRESNTAAAHLVFVAALAGVLFLKSRNWAQRVFYLVAGGFTVNAIVLTQSRAAILALAAGGAAAPFLARRGKRLVVVVCLILGACAAYALTNKNFWSRAETMTVDSGSLEESARSRLEVWRAGLNMWADNPLGVGAGSFYTVIGRYDAHHAGRDCHNTYIRCAAELGTPGLILFLALLLNAFRTLRRASRLAVGTPFEDDIAWDCYGMQLALIAYLTAGWFIGLTYVEELWWFLCLPVCLERSALNAARTAPRIAQLPAQRRAA
jgi:O-antigen ligase